jgi:hypothetical protein
MIGRTFVCFLLNINWIISVTKTINLDKTFYVTGIFLYIKHILRNLTLFHEHEEHQ